MGCMNSFAGISIEFRFKTQKYTSQILQNVTIYGGVYEVVYNRALGG